MGIYEENGSRPFLTFSGYEMTVPFCSGAPGTVWVTGDVMQKLFAPCDSVNLLSAQDHWPTKMSQRTNVSFPGKDGLECPGYLAGKSGSPGLIVLQEFWGMNSNIRNFCDRFAAEGYVCLAPDLYRGTEVDLGEMEKARHIVDHLDWQGAVKDIIGAVQYLKSTGSPKVAVTGFCMGGGLALAAAANSSDVDCAVPFYGIPRYVLNSQQLNQSSYHKENNLQIQQTSNALCKDIMQSWISTLHLKLSRNSKMQ